MFALYVLRIIYRYLLCQLVVYILVFVKSFCFFYFMLILYYIFIYFIDMSKIIILGEGMPSKLFSLFSYVVLNRTLTIHSTKRAHWITPKLAKFHTDTAFIFCIFLGVFLWWTERGEGPPCSISLPKQFDILLQFINHKHIYCLVYYLKLVC